MNDKGLMYKLMLGVILFVGFCAALLWPQMQKKLTIRHARRAVETGRQLAAAEQSFFKKNGFYTADFTQLGLDLPCPVVVKEGRSVLHCAHYDFMLEEASLVRVSSVKYPKWFTVSLADGAVMCAHEDGSWVGEAICAQMDL